MLQYFLAVAREQSISAAAEYLHITQPTLSRQLRDMEEELGCQLLIRGNRRVMLTEQGMLLRKRAEEILELVHKAEDEMNISSDSVTGDITIGAGESGAFRRVAQLAREVQSRQTGIRFHTFSGEKAELMERLDKGLMDFAVLLGDVDAARYEAVPLPEKDAWGVLLPAAHPLAERSSLTPGDLERTPLLLPRSELEDGDVSRWFLRAGCTMQVAGTFSLMQSAALMAEAGMGLAVTLSSLSGRFAPELSFRPLEPALTVGASVVWKRYQIFSRAGEVFAQALRDSVKP